MHKPEAGALKRKLDALGYTNQDEASDIPLVRRIVDDLIHTTDCYLALKQQASSGIQHVEVLTIDTEHLATENNQLHLRLIREAEEHRAHEREHLKKQKSLEDAVAELTFWKSSITVKHAELERENAALKGRLQELLESLESYRNADSDGEGMAFKPLRLDMTEPLLQRSGPSALDPPARNPLAENIDILRATQRRVVSLEAALKAKEAELQSTRQDMESLQECLKVREDEIVRLGKEASRSRNVDALALQHRCEAQECLILQLTEQVDSLKKTVGEAEAEVARREDVTAQLTHCEKARQELEYKLRDAVRDNAAASREVKTMRASLKAMQLGKLRQPARPSKQRAAAEVSESTTRALELAEQRLAEAAAELQRRAAALADIAAERDTATAEVARMKGLLQTESAREPAKLQTPHNRLLSTGMASKGREASSLKDQIKFLSDERAVMAEECTKAATKAERLEKELSQAVSDRNAMRAALTDAQTHIHGLSASLQTITAEKDKALERQRAAEGEAAHLRQALARQAAEDTQTDTERCRQAEQLLAQQLGVCSRVSEELAKAKQQLEAAMQQASALEAQCSSLQQELHASREAHESAESRAHTARHELARAQAVAEERSAEVAQLREVSLQADAALQQCLAQLQALNAEADASQGKLERAAEAQHSLQAEVESLRKANESESSAALAAVEEKKAWITKAKATEEELKDAMQQHKALQQAAAAAKKHAADAAQRQAEHAEENAALRQEIQAIAEDLEALVRENQMIGRQLVSLTAERDRWQGDISASREHAQRAEALARARQSENTQLCREHEALLTERRCMEADCAALQRDMACGKGELAARCDDIAVLKDAHAAAEAQVTQLSNDVQAWEQQVAVLSRQLSKLTADKEDADRERQALLDSLRASEQAKFNAEQQRAQLQQAAAGLSGQVHMLTGRCEDAEADVAALQHRLSLEAERVADLESLLSHLRASQFHLQGSVHRSTALHLASEADAEALARASRKAASLEAALVTAEAKIGSLQSRIRELRTENTSLTASLSAARAERNALNAAIKASASGDGSQGPGPSHSLSQAGSSNAALATVQADAVQMREENARLLDLLSRVDAEREALERANCALRRCDSPADGPYQSLEDAEAEAARLALELAQEKSQRQKAENDFEVLLENLERQARQPDSPLRQVPASGRDHASPVASSPRSKSMRSTRSSSNVGAKGLSSPLSSDDGAGRHRSWMGSHSTSRHASTLCTPRRPSGTLAAYVSQLSVLSSHGHSYAGSSQADVLSPRSA